MDLAWTHSHPSFIREELEFAVRGMLATAQNGRLDKMKESARIDFKEEAGRRDRQGSIQPGCLHNDVAATHLANEVACFANTPDGGALVVGIEDRTGIVIGTELDIDWLRQRIDSAVGVAPDIQAYEAGGQRVLAIYVAQAIEPVENAQGQLRWRVGDRCAPVDRSQWWSHWASMREFDHFAQKSPLRLEDVRRGAIDLIREEGETATEETDEGILRRVGALRSDGYVTQAGALLFGPAGRTLIELTILDVAGGEVLNTTRPSGSLSLMEQLMEIEAALNAVNVHSPLVKGLVRTPLRLVPGEAVREALLNGLMHRDWNRRAEPTDVRWIDQDSTLIVRSPGGFPEGITSDNVLSNRNARYPALADLFRALGMVEKQGLGVDRMYQAMISVGHPPPHIRAVPGPFVECDLYGGAPLIPFIEMMGQITPTPRQRDVSVALVIHELLHRPFITVDSMARTLQSSREQAQRALAVAAQTSLGKTRLIRRYKSVWLLGEDAWRNACALPVSLDLPCAMMAHVGTDLGEFASTVKAWLDVEPKVTTGDVKELTGVSRPTAKKLLEALVDRGELELEGQGRSAGYVRLR